METWLSIIIVSLCIVGIVVVIILFIIPNIFIGAQSQDVQFRQQFPYTYDLFKRCYGIISTPELSGKNLVDIRNIETDIASGSILSDIIICRKSLLNPSISAGTIWKDYTSLCLDYPECCSLPEADSGSSAEQLAGRVLTCISRMEVINPEELRSSVTKNIAYSTGWGVTVSLTYYGEPSSIVEAYVSDTGCVFLCRICRWELGELICTQSNN